MPFGAELLAAGGCRFRLWAPARTEIRVAIDGGAPIVMRRDAGGWHERVVADVAAGSRYRFLLPDDLAVPDPASRFQPEDVHGPSEVIDPFAYRWRASGWRTRRWHETVLYEIHVGSFTADGTFRAATGRLDYLRALGITAIQLMPVADFPGTRNWGYDGVLLYAPDSSYGRPEDFKAFVDTAHEHGIQVLLDVVYNHLGPDGNYLAAYAPQFFSAHHRTLWGAALNFDGECSGEVREFVIHNALYWLEEYQLDGLRLDAVHAIRDTGRTPILEELAARARALRAPLHLLLENEENEPALLRRDAAQDPVLFTAQWNDDVHHVLHVAATAESRGYYADYLDDTALLGRALAEGFAFQGQLMPFRGTPRGAPSAWLPPLAFVAFLQNHDQIGNRAFGERLTTIASPEALRAMVAVCLLLPQVPMLFMGEEWGAAQPFPFFSDFGGALAEAVREGRRQEFARYPEFRDEQARERIPDPEAVRTFESAKLVWADLEEPVHAAWHALYRRLLAVRRAALRPLLPDIGGNAGRYLVIGPGAVVVRWRAAHAELTLFANLKSTAQSGFPPVRAVPFWQEGATTGPGEWGPWSVHWTRSRADRDDSR